MAQSSWLTSKEYRDDYYFYIAFRIDDNDFYGTMSIFKALVYKKYLVLKKQPTYLQFKLLTKKRQLAYLRENS